MTPQELYDVEFVGLQEQWRPIWRDLKARGVMESQPDQPTTEWMLDPTKHAATLIIGPASSSSTHATQPLQSKAKPAHASAGSCTAPEIMHLDVPLERVAATLEVVLHNLHLAPLYLVPFGRWRNVFDVVSFALAENEHWQEIDAQAAVELNTRDALQCEPGDLHLLRDIVRVLLADGDAGDVGAEQGISIIAQGQALVARVRPKRPVEVHIGNARVAAQAHDAAMHFAGRTAS
ncbi:MAG: hypothetical protein SGJ11_08515 [Phycisphaerae bacterium]|nr:hypothetical protein [Phycisphaerae bacterium]